MKELLDVFLFINLNVKLQMEISNKTRLFLSQFCNGNIKFIKCIFYKGKKKFILYAGKLYSKFKYFLIKEILRYSFTGNIKYRNIKDSKKNILSIIILDLDIKDQEIQLENKFFIKFKKKINLFFIVDLFKAQTLLNYYLHCRKKYYV